MVTAMVRTIVAAAMVIDGSGDGRGGDGDCGGDDGRSFVAMLVVAMPMVTRAMARAKMSMAMGRW